MDLVSIIVPVYNVEKYLRECLDSLVKQNYENIEIIIVNDGSTDNSQSIIDEYVFKYKNILSYYKENGGLSSARNHGMRYANGKYIYFMDSDDVANVNLIKKLVSSIEENNTDLSCCQYSYYYKNKKVIADFPNENIITSDNAKKILFLKDSLKCVVWNKLYKKSIIDKYGLYFDEDVKIGEDIEFTIYYLNKIKCISLIKENLYYYRMRKSSLLNHKNERDLTIFDVIKKVNQSDLDMHKNMTSYYALMYFKYYRLLNNTGKIDDVEKLSLVKVLLDKNISINNKKYILSYYFLPEKIKLKIKEKNKSNFFE